MVFDGENTFMYKKAISGATVVSDVVANVNGGDAYNPLWFYVVVNKALNAGPATVELLTSDKEAMTSPVTLGSYKVDADKGKKLAAKLPLGAKAFLQVKVSGQTFTAGEMTAALVADVDLK